MDDNVKMTDTAEWLYLDLKEQSQKPTQLWLHFLKYFRILYIHIYVYYTQIYKEFSLQKFQVFWKASQIKYQLNSNMIIR